MRDLPDCDAYLIPHMARIKALRVRRRTPEQIALHLYDEENVRVPALGDEREASIAQLMAMVRFILKPARRHYVYDRVQDSIRRRIYKLRRELKAAEAELAEHRASLSVGSKTAENQDERPDTGTVACNTDGVAAGSG